MKVFDELKRRNVFRVAGVYAVVGWLLIQIGVAVFPTFDAPPWVLKVVVALLIGGFPVALVLAWAFELTPEGVKLTQDVAEGANVAPRAGRRLDYAILGGLALVVLVVVADRLTPSFETQPSPPAPQARDAASAASIAVLPFADLSPAGDQAYFADGIAEDVLNVLANVGGLDVASRTSSFAFRNRESAGIPAIAAELKVRNVLEGSVRKAGASLRVTAQLIDAENDRHLWSQTYDRPLTAENVFAIQDDIAGAIVAALAGVLGAPSAGTPAVEVAKSTTSLSAYDLYLRARALYQRREKFEDAEALLGEAVEQDPNFADAWALRAATMALHNEFVEDDLPYEENAKRVDDYAGRALALDPDNALAIAARAEFRLIAAQNLEARSDLGAALTDLKRAISLDPRDSSATNWLGMGYAIVGEIGQAQETFAACARFDPFFGPCAENHYDLLVVDGRYDEAWAEYQEVLAKGISVSGWTNFSMLAHFDQKTAFMQATNHPSWLEGWRRHADLYEAFKHPDQDHSELLSDLEEFLRSRPSVNNPSLLLIPIGGFDALPFVLNLWGPDYAAYRRSPQFKSFIRNAGIYDYWREHGLPPQCKFAGDGEFECN